MSQSPLIQAKHLAAPAKKAVEQAVRSGNRSARATAIGALPEMVCVPGTLLVGASGGSPISVTGVWTRSHILELIGTLDSSPTPTLGESHGRVLVAADDVGSLVGPELANEHLIGLCGQRAAGATSRNADGYWEVSPDFLLADTEEAVHRNVAITAKATRADPLPREVLEGILAEHPTPSKTTDFLSALQVASMRVADVLRAHIAEQSSFVGPYGDGVSLAFFASTYPLILPPNLATSPKTRATYSEVIHRTMPPDPFNYAVASMSLACRGAYLFPPGIDAEHLLEKFAGLSLHSFCAMLPGVQLAATCYMPEASNPLGAPGLVIAGFACKGESVHFPTPHLAAPKATAMRSHFFAKFFPSDHSDAARHISVRIPISGWSFEDALKSEVESCVAGDCTSRQALLLCFLGCDILQYDASKVYEQRAKYSRTHWVEAWEVARKMYPEIGAIFETNRIGNKQGFAPLEEIYVKQTQALLKSIFALNDYAAYSHPVKFPAEYCSLSQSVGQGNQVYHVSTALANALHLTDFSGDINLDDDGWPFDGLTFSFAKDSPAGACWFTIARLYAGQSTQVSLVGQTVHDGPKFIASTDSWYFYGECDGSPVMGGGDEGFKWSTISAEFDVDGSGRALLLALKVLLFMQSMPTCIRGGEQRRHQKTNGLGAVVRHGTWAPRVITFPKTDEMKDARLSAATGLRAHRRKVTGHWRRGHCRLQRIGVGLSQQKRIFIWPVFVSGTRSEAR